MNTIPARTIISKKKDDTWFGTDYNMNIYKGCCHGCIYCDSRSDCYHIENFDTVRAKENAIAIIEDELRKKTKSGVIGTGSMSDPYNPFEQNTKLTRKALELINRYQFGITIATKSDLIVRDIDILSQIQKHSPVLCKITVTTIDDELSKKLEPGVCPSTRRLEAVRQLSDAGIFTGILMMPLLPFLTDTKENVLGIISAARQTGAKFIYPCLGLSLRLGQREYFYQQLDRLFPSRNLSKKYNRIYGESYECPVPNANELGRLFVSECKRNGILYKMEDIIAAYKKGYGYEQISLPF